jgi:hypothetical protein
MTSRGFRFRLVSDGSEQPQQQNVALADWVGDHVVLRALLGSGGRLEGIDCLDFARPTQLQQRADSYSARYSLVVWVSTSRPDHGQRPAFRHVQAHRRAPDIADGDAPTHHQSDERSCGNRNNHGSWTVCVEARDRSLFRRGTGNRHDWPGDSACATGNPGVKLPRDATSDVSAAGWEVSRGLVSLQGISAGAGSGREIGVGWLAATVCRG